MALAASNVRSGISGEIFVAPLGTTIPTDATTAPGNDFKGLGYLSEDGIDPEIETSTDSLTAWQNAKVVREFVTGASVRYTFTLIETSKTTVEFAYGTTVEQTGTHGAYTYTPGATGGRRVFMFDVIDGGEVRREIVEEAELTSMNPSAYQNGEAVAFECTVTGYTDPKVYDTSLRSATVTP